MRRIRHDDSKQIEKVCKAKVIKRRRKSGVDDTKKIGHTPTTIDGNK